MVVISQDRPSSRAAKALVSSRRSILRRVPSYQIERDEPFFLPVIRRLEQDHLSADLAAVEELLSSAPPGDVLGRPPRARWFEFRTSDGAILRGRVADNLTADDLRRMNAERANRACTAHVRVVTLTRRGRAHTRYVLQRLEPAN